MTLAILLGAAIGLGLVWLFRLAVPMAPNLSRDIARWDQGRAYASARAAQTPRAEDADKVSPAARTAGWLADRLRVHRGADVKRLDHDLAITKTTLEAWLSKCLVAVIAGVLTPFAFLMLTRLVGVEVPLVLVPVASVVLGALMVVLTFNDLRTEARTLRQEFRRALSIYVDLVAMSLEAGRGHPDALPAAAEIGTGWVFTELQDAINGAPIAGITAWEALGRLGEKYGITELVELRGTLTLAQHDGAKVRSTLIARSHTMRETRITEAQVKANAATETMRHVTLIMAVVIVIYELIPQVMRLFAAA